MPEYIFDDLDFLAEKIVDSLVFSGILRESDWSAAKLLVTQSIEDELEKSGQ